MESAVLEILVHCLPQCTELHSVLPRQAAKKELPLGRLLTRAFTLAHYKSTLVGYVLGITLSEDVRLVKKKRKRKKNVSSFGRSIVPIMETVSYVHEI